MDRINRRKGWLFFILLAAAGAIWAGKSWLFVNSACPRLQDIVLYAVAILVTLVAVINVLITRNDAPFTQFLWVAGPFGTILLLSSIVGYVLGGLPETQIVFCAPDICDRAQLSTSMRDTGKLDGAVEVSRSCLAMQVVPGDDLSCASECSKQLALALYEKAGVRIDTLPPGWSVEKQLACETIHTQLDEALQVATEYGQEDIARAIKEREERVEEKCVVPPSTPTTTPSPTQLDVIRLSRSNDSAMIDVRVVRDSQSILDLQSTDFSLKSGEQQVRFSLEERTADDPVCLIAVVDTSYSIPESGFQSIRDAVSVLNGKRKPSDQLGLVLFANKNNIQVVRLPSTSDLPLAPITGAGDMTALWDGVMRGFEVADSCAYNTQRYLIVLTDGTDNDSLFMQGNDPQTRGRGIAEEAAKRNINVCTVGVQGKLDVDALSVANYGCDYYSAENFDTLASVFEQIFGYVRDFYRLTFDGTAIGPDNTLILNAYGSSDVKVDFSNP